MGWSRDLAAPGSRVRRDQDGAALRRAALTRMKPRSVTAGAMVFLPAPMAAAGSEPVDPAAADMVRQVGDALGQRLRELHGYLLEQVADVDRIACVLYEPKDDMLKT